jgi:hypothetical protein
VAVEGADAVIEELLRLHRAIEQASRRAESTREQRRELKRAFAAVALRLRQADIESLPPGDLLQAALDNCHAHQVPIRDVAEMLYGGASLATRLERG